MVLAANTYINEATYWGNPTQSGFGGITYDAPVTLACRWEDRVEEFVDMAGSMQKSRAIVYLQEAVEVGGWLVKDEAVGSDPTGVSGAMKIQRVDDQPDLRGLNQTYRAWL